MVSLGTGRYEPSVELTGCSKVSLKEKVSKIVDSATDTEGEKREEVWVGHNLYECVCVCVCVCACVPVSMHACV